MLRVEQQRCWSWFLVKTWLQSSGTADEAGWQQRKENPSTLEKRGRSAAALWLVPQCRVGAVSCLSSAGDVSAYKNSVWWAILLLTVSCSGLAVLCGGLRRSVRPWALLPVTRCAGIAPAPCRLPEQGLAGRACPTPQPGTPAQPLASPWGWAEARLGCGLGSGRAVARQGWGELEASPAVVLHGLMAPGADVGSQAMAEFCGARALALKWVWLMGLARLWVELALGYILIKAFSPGCVLRLLGANVRSLALWGELQVWK